MTESDAHELRELLTVLELRGALTWIDRRLRDLVVAYVGGERPEIRLAARRALWIVAGASR